LADGLSEIGGALDDPLEAGLAASQFCEAWALPEPFDGRDLEAAVGVPVVRRLEELDDDPSLAMLRAMQVGANPGVAGEAAAAADRMVAAGRVDPAWWPDAAAIRPSRAARLGEDVFGDGDTVLVEYADGAGRPFTVGVFVDRNAGGIATGLLVGGSIEDHRAGLERHADRGEEFGWIAVHELSLEDAGRRALTALRRTAATFEPEVGDDFAALHAFVVRRLADVASDVADDDGPAVADADERRRLVDAFVAARGAGPWTPPGAPDAMRMVAEEAVGFAADHAGGDPLRWSPVVVEAFLLDWLPRRAALPSAVHGSVPAIVEAWVRWIAERRAMPPRAIELLVDAVGRHAPAMLEALGDESYWGPAKTIVMRALDAGVDVSDPDAMRAFVERRPDDRDA